MARALAARVARGIGRKTEKIVSGGSDSRDECDMTRAGPPAGLLLDDFLEDIQRLSTGDVGVALTEFIAEKMGAFPDGANGVLNKSVSMLEGIAPALSTIAIDALARRKQWDDALGEVAGQSADMTAALNKLEAVSTEESGRRDAVSAAFAAALSALGVGPDIDDAEGQFRVEVPVEPSFDAAQALILAGYAFQAYTEPARGAYWETYTAGVHGSYVSGKKRQTVTTRIAFPNTNAVSASADGVFMVHVEAPNVDEGSDDSVATASSTRPLDKGVFVVAVLNGTALHDDAFRNGSTNFSLLSTHCTRASVAGSDASLSLYAYESRKAFLAGDVVLGEARLPLEDLVSSAAGKPGGVDGELQTIVFEPCLEKAKDDYFSFDVLPDGMALPFRDMLSSHAPEFRKKALADAIGGSSVSVQVKYIPFAMSSGYEVGCGDDDYGEDDDDDDDDCDDEAIAMEVSEAMALGHMPRLWKALARDLHKMVEQLDAAQGGTSEVRIREDMPKTLYIESVSTDSECWIWRDEEKKHIVISFRGTEQVKWQDFFTDALAFLQVWSPGDEIVLDIKSGHTLGLDLWDRMLNGSNDGDDGDLSLKPAVHWGFLRAFMSLRDALDHYLASLSDNWDPEYKYFFTGRTLSFSATRPFFGLSSCKQANQHIYFAFLKLSSLQQNDAISDSLGGALATLAASDLARRHGGTANGVADLDICMMNFGSPRVGNLAFAREFNRLVPHAFRVVCGYDLVARMPKTPYGLRGGYRHVGRSCVVNETGGVWVEGSEDNEFADPFPQTFDEIGDLLRHEREMWSLLASGTSVAHHLEDQYYVMMKGAMRNHLENRAGRM
jgi:Lipase (class 3)